MSILNDKIMIGYKERIGTVSILNVKIFGRI